MYMNEEGVGAGICQSGVPRQDIFLVDKLWFSCYPYDKAKAQIDKSLRKLGTDYIDLASQVDTPPAVNQVEANVFNQESEMFQYLKPFGTHMMEWGPLAEGKNGFFSNPVLTSIGAKYGKSMAQVALRFLL